MTDLVGSAGLPGFEDLLAGDQIAGTREYQEDDFRIIGFPDGDDAGSSASPRRWVPLADQVGATRGSRMGCSGAPSAKWFRGRQAVNDQRRAFLALIE